ncbi:MAG TPA: type VI secretion system tube protein Hcp [Pirellulales bacterium]|nr:type VI secretion system tube protein Hcp [Pirellulales bacterium]
MATDMFLKLDGIKGESKDDKHKDEIDISSWSWGMSQTGTFGTGGGGGAGKVSFHDISISKNVDKATPELMLRCANGKHISEGLLTVRKAGENPVDYLKLKLTDILISSVQHGGGGEIVSESVTLNFGKVNLEYQQQGANGKADGGPVGMGWDLAANKKA